MPFMKLKKGEEEDKFEKFFQLNHYLHGSYDKPEDFQRINDKINEITKQVSSNVAHRIFYLALPPSVYTSVTKLLSQHCKAEK